MPPLTNKEDKWRWGCSTLLLGDVIIGNGVKGGIYIDIGSSQYYLGYNNFGDYSPGTVFDHVDGILDIEQLLDRYGIIIIETEFSAPMSGNNIPLPK
jgi:hypothetical protein